VRNITRAKRLLARCPKFKLDYTGFSEFFDARGPVLLPFREYYNYSVRIGLVGWSRAGLYEGRKGRGDL
jgi:hypothetical protein